MMLEDCEVPYGFQLTNDGAGFQAMLDVVLPRFNLAVAAVALGLCRAVVAATAAHLKSARFEHLGQSLGESLPTLRAQLATMQIDTDGLAARVDDLVEHLERPRDTALLRVLETKAAAGDTAIGVTSTAMRVCGGAAFSKRMVILNYSPPFEIRPAPIRTFFHAGVTMVFASNMGKWWPTGQNYTFFIESCEFQGKDIRTP